MKQEKYVVRSVSDVITNSSNEAYLYCTDTTFTGIKNLFQAIVEFVIGDTEEYRLKNGKLPEFDDYFEMYEGLYDKESTLDYWREENPNKPDPSFEELFKFAETMDQEDCEGSRQTGRLVIKAKNLKANKVAGLLESIQDIFEVEVRYC